MKERWRRSGNLSEPLRVGFVPLCDCAPLVMAQELGLYERFGLQVQLKREVGWATVRDKLIYRELDAAHALAPMAFAASLGAGSVQTDCVSALVLSVNGDAITLAKSIWDAGVRDGGSLRRLLPQRGRPLVFGIPFLYSSHHFLLRLWLGSHGLVLGRDVLVAIVPPPQMPSNLKAGHLDGYCVGEPWNSVATIGRFGWRAATSMDIAPNHPEKALMVRRDFSESRREEHERLIAALVEAGRFCAAQENAERIIETLAQRQYLNVPERVLRHSFEGGLAFSGANSGLPFEAAHEPTAAKAEWILEQMRESGLLPPGFVEGRSGDIFRPDIFQSAMQQNRRYESREALSNN